MSWSKCATSMLRVMIAWQDVMAWSVRDDDQKGECQVLSLNVRPACTQLWGAHLHNAGGVAAISLLHSAVIL